MPFGFVPDAPATNKFGFVPDEPAKPEPFDPELAAQGVEQSVEMATLPLNILGNAAAGEASAMGRQQLEQYPHAVDMAKGVQLNPQQQFEMDRLGQIGPGANRMGIMGPENPEEVAAGPNLVHLGVAEEEGARAGLNMAMGAAEKVGLPVAQLAHGLTIPFRLALGQGIGAFQGGPHEPGEPFIPEIMPRPDEHGFIPSVRRTAGGLMTGGSLITLPMAAESKTLQRLFLGGALLQIPESIRAFGEAHTGAEKRGALTELGTAGLFSTLLGRGLRRGEGMTREAWQNRLQYEMEKVVNQHRADIAAIEVKRLDAEIKALQQQLNVNQDPALQAQLDQLTERRNNASEIAKTAEVHGPVPEPSGEGQGQVPVEEGGAGVRTQTSGGVPQEGEVLLAPEEQAYIDAEREGLDKPVEVRDTMPDGNPFAGGRLATIDRATGKILLNAKLFPQWLAQIPEKFRSRAVKSLLWEERIHLAVSDVMASRYWQMLSPLEKAFAKRRYSDTFGGQFLERPTEVTSEQNFAHEAIRARLQQLMHMDVRETIAAAGGEKWTMRSITAAEHVVRTLRGLTPRGGRGVAIQNAMLDKAQRNLNAAKVAIIRGGAPGANLKQPIEIEDENGQRQPGMFHGYWDMREVGGKLEPAISRQLPNGNWTTGGLHPGEKVVGDVPSFEQWKATQGAPGAEMKAGAEEPKTGLDLLMKYQHGTHNAHEVLGDYIKRGFFDEDPDLKHLSKILHDLGDKGATLKVSPPDQTDPSAGWYEREHDRIWMTHPDVYYSLGLEDETPQTVLHEYVHSLTLHGLEAHPFHRRTVLGLMDKTEEWMNRNVVHDPHDRYLIRYALRNPDEFLAMTFDDPNFRDILKDIPATEVVGGRSLVQTVWDQVVKFIGEVLGFKDDQALSDVLKITLDIGSKKKVTPKPRTIEPPFASMKKGSKKPSGEPELPLAPMKPGEAREAPPELKATPPGELPLAPSGPAKEVRPTTEEFRTPITSKQLEADIASHFEGNPRPSFAKFKEEAEAKYGPMKSGQLYDKWTDEVWKQLLQMPGRELQRIRDSLGLQRKLGSRDVQDARRKFGEGLSLQGEMEGGRQGRAYERAGERITNAGQNYRNAVIARIGERLITEAQTGKKMWRRTEITPEDLGHWRETSVGTFADITADDLNNPQVLGRMLTEGAGVERSTTFTKVGSLGEKLTRTQKAPPLTVTKRITALVDKQTGEVHLVSTYRHPKLGTMMVDPRVRKLAAGQMVQSERPNRPMESLRDRYRPMATMLLDEPVQNFHQVFDNVKDFEDNFAKQARDEMRQQVSYESKFGEPEPELQQKTPWEAAFEGPLSEDEAAMVMDRTVEEVGNVEGPEDIKAAINGLSEAYKEGRLTDTDWDAIAGFAKIYEAIGDQWKLLEPDQIFEQLADELYDKISKADSSQAFAKSAMESYRRDNVPTLQGLAEREGPPPAKPAPETGARELTTVEPGKLPPGFREALKSRRGPTPPSVVPPRVEPERMLSPEEQGRIEDIARQQHPFQPSVEPTPWEAPDDLPEPPTAGGESPSAALKRRYSRGESTYRRIVEALGASVARRGIRRELPALYDGWKNEANLYSTEGGSTMRLASGEPLSRAKPKLVDYLVDPLSAFVENRAYKRARLDMRDEAAMRRSAVHVFIATGKTNKFGKWFPDKKVLPRLRADLNIAEMRAQQWRQHGTIWQKRVAKPWLEYIDDLRQTLDYAEANWTNKKMWQTVKAFRSEMKAEIDWENTKGLKVTDRVTYFPHRYEGDHWHDKGINFGKGASILGSFFRKPKDFPDLFAAAKKGPYIAASLDAAEIGQHRISSGRRMVAGRVWLEALKNLTDPDSGQRIGLEPTEVYTKVPVTDPVSGITIDMPIRTGWKIPQGDYELFYPGTGENVKPMAIRKSYVPLVETLLAKSGKASFPGAREALAITSGLKHGVILVLDTFHPARVSQYGLSLLGFKVGHRGGATALNYRLADMDKAVAQGEISQASVDWAKSPIDVYNRQGKTTMTRKDVADLMVSHGLNATKIADALYKDALQSIPFAGEFLHRSYLGQYNRWLFDKFMPGLMLESAVRHFEKYNKANPKLPIGRLMRDVSRDINTRFGNLGKQGIFRGKSFQDAAQIFLLAPMWQEGLIRSELVAYSRMLGLSHITGRKGLPYLGALGGSVWKGLAVYFGLTQAINMITRGQPTWQNEEKGHQWDAWIPIGKNGLWLSPMAVFAEVTHDLTRLSDDKKTFADAVMQAIANRMGPLGKATWIWAHGFSPTGEEYTTTKARVLGGLSQITPLMGASPISFGIPIRAALSTAFPEKVSPPQPGAAWRQAAASVTGTKVQAAKSILQEENRKVGDWMRENNLDTSSIAMHPTDEASYAKLRNAIRNEDVPEANDVMEELRLKHTDKQIIEAMKEWKDRALTGSLEHERLYVGQLTPDEQSHYVQALRQKQQEFNSFLDYLSTHP